MERALIALIAMLACWAPAPVSAQCMLCAPTVAAAAPTLRPLTIEVNASLDFSRVGLASQTLGGTVIVDPVTGLRSLQGALIDMGGLTMQGSATIRGEPNQMVIVTLPTRVTLSTADGSTLDATTFITDLRNNPRLGSDGTLRFNFGARLTVASRADGDYRGSVPITVDYR